MKRIILKIALFGAGLTFYSTEAAAQDGAYYQDYASLYMGTRIGMTCEPRITGATMSFQRTYFTVGEISLSCYDQTITGLSDTNFRPFVEIDEYSRRYSVDLWPEFDLERPILLQFRPTNQNVSNGAWIRTVVRCVSDRQNKTYHWTNVFAHGEEVAFDGGECTRELTITNYSDYGREIQDLSYIRIYGTARPRG